MADPIRFRVRPVYHGSDLLVEVIGDHRAEGFPSVAAILQDQLHATRTPHPEGLDESRSPLLHDRYISFWTYAGGNYEIDDDFGGLFVLADRNNEAVIADVESALVSTGRFVREFVDFAQYR